MNNKYFDYGNKPFIVNLDKKVIDNNNFRRTLWTGNYLQMTLMNIKPSESIGLERHPQVDQFIKIEKGKAIVEFYNSQNTKAIKQEVKEGFGIFIPNNTWHNITNIGNDSLKLYSIYAPPNHKKGTLHITKKDSLNE